MKKPEELSHLLNELYKETKAGKLCWNIQVQTTEHNEPAAKPIEVEDGVSWTIDECYTAYVCKHKGQDFCMITYELIKTAGAKVQTTNLIFMPPMGLRAFHLQTLLPYAIQASAVLANQIHNLWELLLVQYKADKSRVHLDVNAASLVIEDER